MQRSSMLFNILGAAGLAVLLSGCGSGGGGTTTTTSIGETITGTAASSGTVTGFGSVFVNAKEYDTSRVSFVVDGQSGGQDDVTLRRLLKLGMTVTVTGSFNDDQWVASTLLQKDAVEGLVQSIAADGLSLVVMGQTVAVNSDTLIDDNIDNTTLNPNRDIRKLVVGDFVEVNGHIRPDGVIEATLIEKKVPGPLTPVTPEVRGLVSAHDDKAKTFKIGNLTVDYTGADISTMPNPVGNVWDSLFVEIPNTGSNTFDLTRAILTVTKVQPEKDGLGDAPIDEFEVEGFVTEVVDRGDFFIGTTHARTTGRTEFLGKTIDKIVVGTKLSADGRLVDGTLEAKHVIFHATEARALTIGFDGITLGPFSSGSEARFNIGPSSGGTWSIEASGLNRYLSSTLSGSNFQVELPPSGIGNNRKPIFPEFTAQGLDVSSSGGQTTFIIVGLRDVNVEVFRFPYSTSSHIFNRISVAHEALNNPNFTFRNLVDNTNRPFDVNLDKVERLVISAIHGNGITSNVDCIHVGAGANTCISESP